MFKKFLILTFKGIRYRTLRSWLTILGIVIGIMLVVIIFALSGGIQKAVRDTLQMFGSDLVVIFPGKETNPLVGFLGGQKFREKDLMALENIEGIDFVIPMDVAMMNVEFKGEKKSVMIHAAPWKRYSEVLESSQGVNLAQGRWPLSDQVNETVLGYLTAKSLFKKNVWPGDEIIIKSKRMKVVGTITEIGSQMDDNVIFVSLEIFRNLTGNRGGTGTALVKLKSGADINLVTRQIKFQLGKQEVVRDFSVLTPEKADKLVGNVLSIVELVLIIIAFISLIVGAVGIMNTMYTSVLERTRQIGVMKAIGATYDNILSLFLIESGMIGLFGGLLGILLGLLSAYGIGAVVARMGIRGIFSWSAVDYYGLFAVLLITFITGVIAGILPARQAAKMEPAQALRYE